MYKLNDIFELNHNLITASLTIYFTMHQIKDHKIANTVAVKSIYYNDDNLTTTAFDVSI